MNKRTMQEIEKEASIWWPQSLKRVSEELVDPPRLLETQSEFLSILTLSKRSPFKVFDLISASDFPANLFVKHLVILTDFGGEPIKRLGKSFAKIFPEDEHGYYFDFSWYDQAFRYRFEVLPVKGLSNTKLKIDGLGQKKSTKLGELLKDMIAILLFAGSSNIKYLAGLDICNVGELLGDENRLVSYVRQKYLVVSRITGGAMANSLGQTAQKQAVKFLQYELGEEFVVKSNGKIELEGYENAKGMPFDIVVIRGKGAKIGIELSFQVTTNSTIERKAGQAANRQDLMHRNGHFIGYILDGAGNFERVNAFKTIIHHSDCTVAYSESEFMKLADWIRNTL